MLSGLTRSLVSPNTLPAEGRELFLAATLGLATEEFASHRVRFGLSLNSWIDKGYDDQKIRRLARQHEVRPLIKHREFTPLHRAWNARLDTDIYGQRSQSETVNSTLNRKYGAFVRSWRW